MVGKFITGEKILCYHGPLIYQARILAISKGESGEPKYHVHYDGWKSKWNEWVGNDRVLELNEANLTKQRLLQQEKMQLNKRKRGSSSMSMSPPPSQLTPRIASPPNSCKHSPHTSTSGDGSLKLKIKLPLVSLKSRNSVRNRTRSTAGVINTIGLRKNGLEIKIPDELKLLLVADMEAVKDFKLLKLPVPHNNSVRSIIDSYIASKALTKGITVEKLSYFQEAALGILDFFEATLGTQLLYGFERVQYMELMMENQGKVMESQGNASPKVSELYGFIHLLRLFVRLGSVLSESNSNSNIEKYAVKIEAQVADFLKFLVKNQVNFFNVEDYYSPPLSYTRQSFAS